MTTTTMTTKYTVRVRTCALTGDFLGAYPEVWDPVANGAVDGGEWHETDIGQIFEEEEPAQRLAQTLTRVAQENPAYLNTFIKTVRRGREMHTRWLKDVVPVGNGYGMESEHD